jgi:hypothetical protein
MNLPDIVTATEKREIKRWGWANILGCTKNGRSGGRRAACAAVPSSSTRRLRPIGYHDIASTISLEMLVAWRESNRTIRC